jgi:membrane-bound lytic murein transglycosylase D
MYDSMMVLGADYASPDTAAGRLIQMHGLPAVIVSKSQNPEDIAKLYDMGVWQIYKYNDLRKGEELKPGEIVYLKPKKRKADENYHLVKEGETLRDISQQHGVKLKHLEKFNHIISSQPLKPGEVIYLREKRRKDSADAAEAVKKTESANTVDTSNRLLRFEGNSHHLANPTGTVNANLDKFQKTEYNTKSGNGLVYHTVLPGETVYSISRLYNIPADSLIKWNGISDAKIRVGQELRLNSASKRLQQKSSQIHTVSAGETLYQISRRYAVSVSDLQAKNNLKSPEIKAGQVLQIP